MDGGDGYSRHSVDTLQFITTWRLHCQVVVQIGAKSHRLRGALQWGNMRGPSVRPTRLGSIVVEAYKIIGALL